MKNLNLQPNIYFNCNRFLNNKGKQVGKSYLLLMLQFITHPVMHGINEQFTTTLSNEGTYTGLQLDILID